MLVLSRHAKEWIDIGNDIQICVVKISGKQVRLGINAPKDVSVVRRELDTKESNEPTVLLCEPKDVDSFKKLLDQRNEPQ